MGNGQDIDCFLLVFLSVFCFKKGIYHEKGKKNCPCGLGHDKPCVGYDFGWLSLQWNTVFAGADGKTKSGKRAYSSYAEVSVPFRLGGCQWKATVGAVPYATDYYADAKGFAVTHVALRAEKELTLSQSFRLPLFAGIYANPSTEKAYYVIGFTIR